MAYLTVEDVVARIGDRSERFTPERVAALQERFEQVAEEYLGCRFYSLGASEDDEEVLEYQPLERTVTVRSRGGSSLALPDMFIVEITGVTVDDIAWTEDQLEAVDIDLESGVIHGCYWWYGAAAFTYTYGNGTPPPALLDAEVAYVKARGIGESTDRNPAIENYDDGSPYSYTVGRADPANGKPTGLIVVDDALNEIPNHRVPSVA